MSQSIRKQRGHAMILFAMFVPLLFGVFNLGSEGARALQQKARMNDALEVAVLAISAYDDDNEAEKGKPEDFGSAVNRQIVADFVSVYFPNEKIKGPQDLTNLKIRKKQCEQIAECSAGNKRFSQYEVTAAIEYETWFVGNESVAGFDKKLNLAGQGTSRKFQTNAIDVMLVADFSGSMDDGWKGGNKKKYQDLVDIIGDVAKKLDDFNSLAIPDEINTLGVVPFNHYVHRKADPSQCNASNTIINGIGNVEHVRFNKNNTVNYVSTIFDVTAKSYLLDSVCAVDETSSKGANFYNIALTDKMISKASGEPSLVKLIASFKPKGGTASYLGLIDAYKLLLRGQNKKRLLILLSDGQDSPNHSPVGETGPKYADEGQSGYWQIGQNLIINHQLCEVIKGGLSSGNIDTTLYLIGFDYKEGETNKALDRCVGSENILYAQNKKQITDKLFSLITEEIGHLK